MRIHIHMQGSQVPVAIAPSLSLSSLPCSMAKEDSYRGTQGYGWTAPTWRAGSAAEQGSRWASGRAPAPKGYVVEFFSADVAPKTAATKCPSTSCEVASVAAFATECRGSAVGRGTREWPLGRRTWSQTGEAPQKESSGRCAPTGWTAGEAWHTLTGPCLASQPGPSGSTERHSTPHESFDFRHYSEPRSTSTTCPLREFQQAALLLPLPGLPLLQRRPPTPSHTFHLGGA